MLVLDFGIPYERNEHGATLNLNRRPTRDEHIGIVIRGERTGLSANSCLKRYLSSLGRKSRHPDQVYTVRLTLDASIYI